MMTEREDEERQKTTQPEEGAGALADTSPGEAVGSELGASAPDAAASGQRPVGDVEYDLIAAMKTVYDPEIPVDIYELGLIYELNVADDGATHIVMTLTTPMCPAAEILPAEVEAKAREVEGVGDVRLELVWEPPWSMDMMSPAARLQLNV